jgi:uncharacterized radical SAM superfamily protein
MIILLRAASQDIHTNKRAKKNMNKNFKLIYTDPVLSVSTTKDYCELNCKHCNKRYLKSMYDIDDKNLIETLKRKDKSTVLISGGSLKDGSVPFYKQMQKIEKLKNNGYLLNVHTGFLPSQYFHYLTIFDSISIDIVGDQEILKEVYNLDVNISNLRDNILQIDEFLSNARFKNSDLNEKIPKIVPHITIGILNYKDSYEEKAIDFIGKLNVDKVIFNFLIPTKGTFYAKAKMLEIKRLSEIINYARSTLPGKKIYIGCMRPFGKSRVELDFACFELSVDAIVNPSKEFVIQLKKLYQGDFSKDGSFIEINEGCCSLI